MRRSGRQGIAVGAMSRLWFAQHHREVEATFAHEREQTVHGR